MRVLYSYIICVFSIVISSAQILPNHSQKFVHPYFQSTVFPGTIDLTLMQKDSLINERFYGSSQYNKNWLVRKVRYEHLYKVRVPEFQMNISPLLILDWGKVNGKAQNLFRNTRGVLIETNVDQKFGFTSTFFENQSTLIPHVETYAEYFGVIPGQGFHKSIQDSIYDFAWVEGMVYLKPNKQWDIQFGHAKRFVGNGYRSMLYSDNAFANMQLFYSWQRDQWKYHTWYASFTSPDLPEPYIIYNHAWPKKAGNFHFLQYFLSNNTSIGLFEGTIVQSRKKNGAYDFNPVHFNPVILLNSLSKNSNSILGINLNTTKKHFTLYGQIVSMPYQFSKQAFQIGTSYNKSYQIGQLFILTEINHASNGMYTFTDTTLAYTQYNQPIAHPMGEDFTEFIFQSKIRHRSFELEYKYNFIFGESDTTGFLPAINLFYSQPNQSYLSSNANRSIQEIKCSYIINPHYNLRLTLGAFIRNYKSTIKETNIEMVYISLQTPIFNRYYDF